VASLPQREVREMTERLLTDEEIKLGMSDIKNQWLHSKGRKTVFEKDCFDSIINLNRFAQNIKTLKAVGEWLNERVMCEHLAYYHRRFTCEGCVNQLLRGEMPEEAQVKSEMGFTEEELKDLRHNASDDTIG